MVRMVRQSHAAPSRREMINLAVLGFFLFGLLVFGGASRPDELGQPAIRVISILVIFWAWVQAPVGRARWSTPCILLSVLGLWIAVQLVPLPPDAWSRLGGRAFLAEGLASAGIAPVWRPMSLTPDLTLNALLALLPSAAAFAVLARLPRRAMSLVLTMLLAMMVASMVLGILQASAGGPYLYRSTSEGLAVGSFANRNHFALFLGCLLPLLAAWSCRAAEPGRDRTSVRDVAAASIALIVFATLLVVGSRGGLLTGGLGAVGAFAVLVSGRPEVLQHRRLSLVAGSLVATAMVAGMFAFFARAMALDRLLQSDHDALRSKLGPLTLHLITEYLPFGSGFGSFATVFAIVEPTSMLDVLYVNQAHNDWLQLPLEGGIPALAILLVGTVWTVWRSWKCWRNAPAGPERVRARAGSVVIGLIAISSLFDYPMRTPTIGTLLAVMLWWLAIPATARRSPLRQG